MHSRSLTITSRSESDHMPIVAKISCTLSDTNSPSHDQDLSYIHRYKWQLEFAPSFVDMLNDSSSIDSWKMFHEELNNNNTDAAVSVFVDLLQWACEPMKCDHITITIHVSHAHADKLIGEIPNVHERGVAPRDCYVCIAALGRRLT